MKWLGFLTDFFKKVTPQLPPVTTSTAYANGSPIGPVSLMLIGNGKYLETSRAKAFLAMQASALSEAGITLTPNSGFRSMEEQTVLYNEYVARDYKAPIVAKPGTSNHQRGDAVDIEIPPSGTLPDDPRRILSPEFQWMKVNGKRFGFRNDLAERGDAARLREAWHWSSTGR